MDLDKIPIRSEERGLIDRAISEEAKLTAAELKDYLGVKIRFKTQFSPPGGDHPPNGG